MTDESDVKGSATTEGLLRAMKLLDSVRERLDPDARGIEVGFEKLKERFYSEFWRSAVEGVGADLEDMGDGYLRVRRGGAVTFVRGSLVQLDNHLTLEMAGNKPFTHRLLAEYGAPTPPFLEFSLSSLSRAEEFLRQLPGSAVVKPAGGTGAGNGVTMGVDSPGLLRRAAFQAAAWSRRLLIEAELQGSSYRILYLGGRFVDAVRRDPPAIVGDGRSSVRKLIRAETHARLAADPLVSLHPLTLDLTCRTTLRAQGLGPSSVLEEGRRVVAKFVVNQNAARDNHCVREEIHPSIVDTGRRIVETLGIELGGIDVLAADITLPLSDGNGVVNEVNTTPGLHHHVLVADDGAAMPVGELVLEHIFSRSQGHTTAEGPPQPQVGR